LADVLKVLAIDGGGIRALIPATLLAEIEARTQSRIAELFDLIAGTSSGGILALALVKPSARDDTRAEYTAADLADLFEKEGARMFLRTPFQRTVGLAGWPDVEPPPIEPVLKQLFGDVPLSEALTETLVTSYELETREPWFFARHKARSDMSYDFPMRFVASATSAAPTYFEPEELTQTTPHGGLVDGGVFANNPAMCAYVEVKQLYPHADDVLVVSLGTGQHTRPIHYAEAKSWGPAHWAKPILDVVFDGVSDTVDHQMTILCRNSDEGDPRYFRYQSELNIGSDDIDNATTTNIAALKHKAHELIEEQSASLDQLCRELWDQTAVRPT
jgi:patatin-like phospholipase/acyl hydrolase